MSVPTHLTIQIEGLPFDSPLADWRWLVSTNLTPIMMTAFGDLFFRDDAGHVHFLDLMAGQFKEVAESEERFISLCEDRDRRRIWFIGFLLMELRKTLGELALANVMAVKFHSRLVENWLLKTSSVQIFRRTTQ